MTNGEFGAVSPELFVQGHSLQADRFRLRMLLQKTSGFLFETMLKGSLGTDVIPVLSQMILDKVAANRAALWLGVKTPGFSYHSLIISNKRSSKSDQYQQVLYLKCIYFWDCVIRLQLAFDINEDNWLCQAKIFLINLCYLHWTFSYNLRFVRRGRQQPARAECSKQMLERQYQNLCLLQATTQVIRARTTTAVRSLLCLSPLDAFWLDSPP